MAPGNEDYPEQHWYSFDKSSHPVLVAEKKQATKDKNQAAHEKRLNRDKGKRIISRKAAKAEKTTESNIIKSTVNSGRLNKDGDHVAADMISLDTKLQTTRTNPIIELAQLEKVRNDAKRAGTIIGGLVLRNCNGVGVVVFTEADFAIILSRLVEE